MQKYVSKYQLITVKSVTASRRNLESGMSGRLCFSEIGNSTTTAVSLNKILKYLYCRILPTILAHKLFRAECSFSFFMPIQATTVFLHPFR